MTEPDIRIRKLRAEVSSDFGAWHRETAAAMERAKADRRWAEAESLRYSTNLWLVLQTVTDGPVRALMGFPAWRFVEMVDKARATCHQRNAGKYAVIRDSRRTDDLVEEFLPRRHWLLEGGSRRVR